MLAARKILVLTALVLALLAVDVRPQAAAIDLSGKWRFALDRDGKGISDNWYSRSLGDSIVLPGALQSQGFGDEISTKTPWVLSLYDRNWFEREDYKAYTKAGKTLVPFLSQPPRHYLGAAWYQRTVNVPAEWAGKRVELFLERPHWESRVWVDGKPYGSARSLVAPHIYDLGTLAPGGHTVTVRVDNSLILPYRPDAHSVSDSLGMSWNGIVGKIELRATSKVWIDDAQIFAPTPAKPVIVKVSIGNSTGKPGIGTLTANGVSVPVSWDASGGSAEIEVPFPVAKGEQRWNEFHPVLTTLAIRLTGEDADDSRSVRFGFRDLKAVGNEFQLNGRRIYFRGTHHGGDFPLTGYPPTDVAYWRKIFQINKDWGINHIRFHSFCPPEAAFEAADELGIYLQPEPGTWNEISPGTELEKMLYEETDAMIKAYGNHPSFLLLSPSNEPKGRWKEALDKWIAHYRIADPRRLYTNGTGHTEREVPGLAEGADYLAMQRIGPKMLRGNTAWFAGDYGGSLRDINIPVVSHELGQWVAYPDYDIIRKFTGYMRPGNYQIFRDSLAAKGMLARDKDFAYASGKYQLACYKEEIEANLRTPGLSGYQLLDLHDYLGQGTALVGLLDAFWEEKGYVTAQEFHRFNGPTVPLARIEKRVLFDFEKLVAQIEIAHFGEKPLTNATPYWKLIDDRGNVFAQGQLPSLDIPIGKNIKLGEIVVPFSDVTEPTSFDLQVGLTGSAIQNDWKIWVCPYGEDPVPRKDVVMTHSWDEAEIELSKGSKVFYIPPKAELDWKSPPLDWIPVFWNRLMNPAWGRMLGLWIDNKHPALKDFPTESYFDWQWTELVRGTRAVNLDRLPSQLQPIVQPIDDWNRNYKLGLIFEARVGRGKLLVSSIDLENPLDWRLSARQLRRSLLTYMASAAFDPKTRITTSQMRSLFFDTRIMNRLGARITADGDAGNLIDGDPNTFWIAGTQRDTERRPHSITIEFPAATKFSGVVIMPRQNHREHEGDVREYLLQISEDGEKWTDVKRGELASTFDPQKILLGGQVNTKYLRFTALSGFGTDKTVALSEIAIVYTGPKLPETVEELEYQRNKAGSPDIDEGVPAEQKKPAANKRP